MSGNNHSGKEKKNIEDIQSQDKNLRYLAGFFDTLIQIDLEKKRKLPGVKKQDQSYNNNAKDKNYGKN